MKKVLLVIDSLQIGGISSAFQSLLVKLYDLNEFEIYVQVLDNQLLNFCGVTQIMTSNHVRVLYINKKVLSHENFHNKVLFLFTRVLKKIIGEVAIKKIFFSISVRREFDVVVSFCNDIYNKERKSLLTNLFVDLSTKSKNKIAWLHADPLDIALENSTANNVYRNFNHIVCVSKEHKSKVDIVCNSLINKTIVIKNFINKPQIYKKSLEYIPNIDKDKFTILTVARVEFATKGIDRIVDITNKLIDNKILNFNWYIVGYGKDFDNLRTMIVNNQLSSYIHLEGEKRNPYPYMKYANLFVLPSRYEAYPVVIMESLFLKLPAIVTNYPSSVEQIDNGINGFITENDSDSIFDIIQYVIRNDYDKKMKSNLEQSNFIEDEESICNIKYVMGVKQSEIK